jgi:hypothetical protein
MVQEESSASSDGGKRNGDASSSDSDCDDEFLDEMNEPLSPLKNQAEI